MKTRLTWIVLKPRCTASYVLDRYPLPCDLQVGHDGLHWHFLMRQERLGDEPDLQYAALQFSSPVEVGGGQLFSAGK